MKISLIASFVAVGMLGCVVGCSAPTDESDTGSSEGAVAGNTSGYTELNGCKVTAAGEEGEGWEEANCGGMGGYEFLVHSGDLRQMVSIRTSTGDHDLELYGHLPAWGYLGPKAEWRGTYASPGQTKPSALIFRYFQETEDQPARSFLVVAKLSQEAACIYSVVPGNQADANVKARIEADRADTVTCAPRTPRPLESPECGVIPSGKGLAWGSSKASCDGRFSLNMQTDGNLVLYMGARALWSSRTAGSAAEALFMRPTGELGIYGREWNALWSANTTSEGATLAIQNDGNLVVYAKNGRPLWASNTAGH